MDYFAPLDWVIVTQNKLKTYKWQQKNKNKNTKQKNLCSPNSWPTILSPSAAELTVRREERTFCSSVSEQAAGICSRHQTWDVNQITSWMHYSISAQDNCAAHQPYQADSIWHLSDRNVLEPTGNIRALIFSGEQQWDPLTLNTDK